MLARLAIAVLVASLSGASASADEAGPPPVLAVDPDDPGPSLPPVGHSLFDFLTTREVDGALVQEVPFPFTALQAQIADALGGAEPDLKQVLIPLGRSLQRNAANPDFFAFPRAVVAVDQESEPRAGEGGMLLADRLYLGFQERAATIEVISYNEAAAGGLLRRPPDLHRLSPQPRADLLESVVGRDQRQSAYRRDAERPA
jgi:hypothetical protein